MKRKSGSLYADEKYRATSAGAEPRRTGCDKICKSYRLPPAVSDGCDQADRKSFDG